LVDLGIFDWRFADRLVFILFDPVLEGQIILVLSPLAPVIKMRLLEVLAINMAFFTIYYITVTRQKGGLVMAFFCLGL
jgi:hypothetical protein